MFKKIVSSFLTVVMLFTFCFSVVPINAVYAAGNIKLEVIKDNAPIREKKSKDGKVVRKVKKGTILTAEKKELNLKLNYWYKLKKGEYIYIDNVKEAHDHKIVVLRYEDAHPHYAVHGCKGCDNGGYCGPETTKVKGCEQCYPSSTASKKENTNKVPNTNVTTKSDILTPTRPSLQEEAEKKLTTPVHSHNYTFSSYSAKHPHVAIYTCSCGDQYNDSSKTTKQKNCTECYPPHTHSYQLIKYGNAHPHYAEYECSCGEGYCSNETSKVKDCAECYPYGYGNDHACDYAVSDGFLNEHPHYSIKKCSVCGKQKIDRTKTNYSSKCESCTSVFKDKSENIPDLQGRVLDLSTGKIIYTSKDLPLDALYDFSKELHTTLDVLGLIPVGGNAFDGINTVYYIIEGNYVDAALSGAAMLPIIGEVSASGKVAKTIGTITIDTATGTVEKASKELTKEIVKKEISNNLTKVGEAIVDNADNYADDVVKGAVKAARSSSITLSEAIYNGEVIVKESYRGSVTSPAGLIYGWAKKDKKHRFYHIIDRHAYSKIGSSKAGNFFKDMSDGEIFDIIDDVYSYSHQIGTTIHQQARSKYFYQAPYVIGSQGEDILCIILEDKNVISAYPVTSEAVKEAFKK